MVYWGCGGAAGQMYRWQLLLTIFFFLVAVVVVDKWPVFPVLNLELQRAALVNLGDLSTYDR